MIFKKVLLAVDLSEMDNTLINYLKAFNDTFTPGEIHIVNVLIPLYIPLNIEDDIIEANKNAEMLKFSDLKRSAIKKLGKGSNIFYHQLSGNPMPELMKFAQKNGIDLIIAGRKKIHHGGIVPERLSRKANCAVLLVPKNVKPSFKKIAVPVDFSEYSKLALRTIKNYSNNLINSQILCIDVLYSPTYPVKNGNTEKVFKEDKSKKAESEFRKFVSRYEDENYSLKTFFAFDDYNEPYNHIIKFAKEKKANLIIMGSKGLTAAASILLGSTAEKVIKNDPGIPILIIKKKNENIGLFKLWFG
jgi:nucleotide-binding universal stress UspA family protein